MSQINLMSGGGESTLPKVGIFSGSLFLSMLVLALGFGSYFGVKFYRSGLDRELASLIADTERQRNLISGEKADRVADFSDRITLIKNNLAATALAPTDPLSRIERSLIPEVNITSYEQNVEEGTIRISVASDSFRALAQYIITLKQNNTFSSVSVDGDSRVGDGGKIESNMILSL